MKGLGLKGLGLEGLRLEGLGLGEWADVWLAHVTFAVSAEGGH